MARRSDRSEAASTGIRKNLPQQVDIDRSQLSTFGLENAIISDAAIRNPLLHTGRQAGDAGKFCSLVNAWRLSCSTEVEKLKFINQFLISNFN